MTGPGRPDRRQRRAVAIAGAAVVGLGLVWPAVAAHSTAASPRQLDDTPDRADGPRLELVDQTFAVAPDGTFTLHYELLGLDGDPLELAPPPSTTTTAPPTTEPDAFPVDVSAPPTTVAPPPVQLTLEVINYPPLVDPDDVAAVVGSDVDPSAFRGQAVDGVALDARPLLTVGDDGTVSVSIDVATDVVDSVGDRLKLDRPGLYPIRVQLLVGDPDDDDVVATAGTVIQRLVGPTDPSGPSPVDLALVVATDEPPPDAPPAGRARSSRQLLAAADLAGAVAAPITLQAAPSTVTALTASADGAERLATSLADDELVAVPLVPLDVSSAVAVDRADAYTRLVIGGEEALAAAVPTTPVQRATWIARGPISGPGAQLLRELGTRLLVMTPDVYRDTVGEAPGRTDQLVDARLPDGGVLPILVTDPLAERLTTDAADEILARSTPAEWAVATLAELLVDQQVADQADDTPRTDRSRILTTPTLDAPDVRLVQALETIGATTPGVRFSAASSLPGVTDVARRDGRPVSVTLPDVAGPSLHDRIALLDATAQTMAGVATMLPDGDPRPAAWAGELAALVSTGYSDAQVLAATAAMTAQADALRDAVHLPPPFPFTLTGRTGTIELRITNTADEPLTVVVQPSSAKMTFPDGDQTVTLRAAADTSVIVPVAARSNGTSAIDVVVSTPSGERLDGPVTLTARVTALSGLGQVLTVGFILVVLSWWFTHWRARRRTATTAPDAAVDDPVESATL